MPFYLIKKAEAQLDIEPSKGSAVSFNKNGSSLNLSIQIDNKGMSAADDITVTAMLPSSTNPDEYVTKSVTIDHIEARSNKKASFVLEDISEEEI